MSNDFRTRIKLTPAPKQGYEITHEEGEILEKMRKAKRTAYKGVECIEVPGLYLKQEDYQRIHDRMVQPVLDAQEKGGESR